MRRADRLFQIIQILRRSPRPITADRMADELEVSRRSVYRDIADLVAQRVPICGEAGVGYSLGAGYDMPPLMLTPDELEAAALGVQWVAERGDAALATAARDLIAKIAATVPRRLRPFLDEASVAAPAPSVAPADRLDLARTRLWIRQGRKMRIRYEDEQKRESHRIIWPILVGYTEDLRLLAAWCELRQAFRHFRTDRIFEAEFLDETHGQRPARLRALWRRRMEERGIKLPDMGLR